MKMVRRGPVSGRVAGALSTHAGESKAWRGLVSAADAPGGRLLRKMSGSRSSERRREAKATVGRFLAVPGLRWLGETIFKTG